MHLFKKHHLLGSGLLLCATGSALAITLGPNTHSAVLGQPLDISVRLFLDAGDNPEALCLDADVFYVDKQLDKSRVQVTAEKSAHAQESLIRIRAAAPVEGPVVTMHLSAGCVQKTVRRYVVLAAATSPLAAGPQAPAPDSLPNAEKAPVLENELHQLREELLKSQVAQAQAQVRFEKAESEHRRKELVYGLAGIVLLTVAGLLFLLRQRPGVPGTQVEGEGRLPWWRRPKPAGTAPESSPSPGTAATGGAGLDFDIGESLLDELKQRPSARSSRPPPESIPPLSSRERARFSVSVPFVARTVKVPELLDLQQQVEFFSSLGQQERAIALLRKHLVNNVKTSALVYLDLLDLYHQCDNEMEYEILRADFNRVFNTQIAPFDSYTAAGRGATAYEDVLARIQVVWPTRQVFEVIDDALFREPGDAAQVLSLEAYRELLLLHAVAREINELDAGGAGHSGDTYWPDLAMRPRSSPRLGLDIDLNQFSDGADSPGKTATRDAWRSRSGAASNDSSLPMHLTPVEPTVFDSLVDFDDYDTGFRPDHSGKPRRS
jgi:hypothetical protein